MQNNRGDKSHRVIVALQGKLEPPTLNAGLKHSKSNLAFEIRNNSIFGMLCL